MKRALLTEKVREALREDEPQRASVIARAVYAGRFSSGEEEAVRSVLYALRARGNVRLEGQGWRAVWKVPRP